MVFADLELWTLYIRIVQFFFKQIYIPLISYASFVCQPTSRSAHGDQDPFKFRWLIPLSALQVRLGNTAGNRHVWLV